MAAEIVDDNAFTLGNLCQFQLRMFLIFMDHGESSLKASFIFAYIYAHSSNISVPYPIQQQRFTAELRLLSQLQNQSVVEALQFTASD